MSFCIPFNVTLRLVPRDLGTLSLKIYFIRNKEKTLDSDEELDSTKRFYPNYIIRRR